MVAEAILLVLWAGSFLFWGIKDYNDRNNRESHAWWLSEVKGCIGSIQAEFRIKCEKIADEEFSTAVFNNARYSSRIRDLEESYRNNLKDRIIKLKRGVRVTTIPDYLEQEYISYIGNISYIFRHFGDLHHQ